MVHSQSIHSLLRLMVIGGSMSLLHTAALQAQSTAVPPSLQPPAGNQMFLKAGAIGTQNYLCMPSGWTFIGPQATLFVNLPWINGTTIRQQVTTHYLSENPVEDGTPRPTWQSSLDTSAVWAKVFAPPVDAPQAGAIPWLLLQAASSQKGPTGGTSLSQTTFIQRLNTTGGVMPTGACTVGERAFVPYTADYVFYRKSN
jgi:hypothetical protein